MFIIGAEQILKRKAGGIQQREHVGLYPFTSQGLGPSLGIIIQRVKLIQQRLANRSLGGNKAVAVHLQPNLTGEAVNHIIYRRNVKGNALVPFPPGNIGKTANVQAIIVLSKKKIVADGNQRSTLPAQHNIQAPEI